jgi:hypothetical protein
MFYCLSYKEEMPVHGVSEAVDTVESLFLLVTCNSGQEHNYELKVCLRCAVSLCQVHRDLCPRFVDLIGTRLMGTSGWHSPCSLVKIALIATTICMTNIDTV